MRGHASALPLVLRDQGACSGSAGAGGARHRCPLGDAFNLFVIRLTAFLTVVELFETQAVLVIELSRHSVVAEGV